MTRFKRRALFALGGLVAGAVAWVSVGVSEEKPAPASNLPVPSSGAPGSPQGYDTTPGPGGVPSATPAVPRPSLPDVKTEPATTPPAGVGGPAAFGLAIDTNLLLGSGPGGGGGSPAQSDPAEAPALKVIPLRRVHATSMRDIVETLFPAARGSMATDASTNSLIVRVPASVFAEIEQLVNVLDSMEVNSGGPASQDGSRAGGSNGATLQLGGLRGMAPPDPRVTKPTTPSMGVKRAPMSSGMMSGPGGYSGLPTTVDPSVPTSSSELKKRYEAADRAAQEMARTMRANPGNDSHQPELRRLVSQAFALRQEMLRSELEDFQRRMLAIHETISLRDRVSDKIVERRMNDLLAPNTQWEPSPIPTGAGSMGPGSSGAFFEGMVRPGRGGGMPGEPGPAPGATLGRGPLVPGAGGPGAAATFTQPPGGSYSAQFDKADTVSTPATDSEFEAPVAKPETPAKETDGYNSAPGRQ